MPTSVDLKCPHKKCGLPMRVVRVDDESVKCVCRGKFPHETIYTKKYFQRFLNPKNVRGDLPQECPKCGMPIRERSRTVQNDAKQLGRVDCQRCQTSFLYDRGINCWVEMETE